MTFINDYRPTLRVGLDELHGAVNIMRDRIDEARDNDEATVHYYEGALLVLLTIENGRYEYPADFMAVYERNLGEYLKGDF